MKFKIIYLSGDQILTIENRTHTTGVAPSEKMVKSALHTILLDMQKGFENAKALVFKEDRLINTYTLF